MWFLRFSIAIIRTAFEKNSQLSIHTVQVGGWMVFFFENLLSYLAYSQIWLNMKIKLPEISSAVVSMRALARCWCCVVRSLFPFLVASIRIRLDRRPSSWSIGVHVVPRFVSLDHFSGSLFHSDGICVFLFCFCTLIYPWLAT
jgi:hypothetical protein